MAGIIIGSRDGAKQILIDNITLRNISIHSVAKGVGRKLKVPSGGYPDAFSYGVPGAYGIYINEYSKKINFDGKNTFSSEHNLSPAVAHGRQVIVK